MTGKQQTAQTVQLHLLGEFRLVIGGCDLTAQACRSAKLRSILCYLILYRERAVSRDELIENFYDDEYQKDPVSALKMQIMRIRQMLAPGLPEGVSAIVGSRGTYQWNPELPCQVDVETFGVLCLRAGKTGLDPDLRCDLYREALALYTGDPALKNDELLWSSALVSRYHSFYITAAEEYARLLIDRGDAPQTEAVCLQAIRLEPAGETFYILLIRALLLQRRYGEARLQYRKAADALYQQLGLQPSYELKRLYDGITEGTGWQSDLATVMDEMRETEPERTAFFCGFDQFRSIYQLEARRASRTGTCLHVAMFSVGEGCDDRVMEQLQQTVVRSLRSSDVVARYSGSQFIIMLPEADLEDSGRVMERLVSAYRSRYPRETAALSWQIRALELQ